MKPVKCANGHYYDSEKYTECPHCNAAPSGNPVSRSDDNMKQKHSIFGRSFSSEKKKAKQSEHVTTQKKYFSSNENNSLNNKAGADLKNTSSEHNEKNDRNKNVTDSAEEMKKISDQQTEENNQSGNSSKNNSENISVSSEHKNNESNERESLADSIRLTNSTSVSQDSKTVGLFSTGGNSEPVSGWLVCVKGQYRGESFSLKVGRNNIGRSLNMDIPFPKEGSISRDRHASIIFDPKTSRFILQAGEENGLTYHNDELLIGHTVLSDYDVIQFGQAEFVFCSFCGEKFSWDQYLK